MYIPAEIYMTPLKFLVLLHTWFTMPISKLIISLCTADQSCKLIVSSIYTINSSLLHKYFQHLKLLLNLTVHINVYMYIDMTMHYWHEHALHTPILCPFTLGIFIKFPGIKWESPLDKLLHPKIKPLVNSNYPLGLQVIQDLHLIRLFECPSLQLLLYPICGNMEISTKTPSPIRRETEKKFEWASTLLPLLSSSQQTAPHWLQCRSRFYYCCCHPFPFYTHSSLPIYLFRPPFTYTLTHTSP